MWLRKKAKPLLMCILSFAILLNGFPNFRGNAAATENRKDTSNSGTVTVAKDMPAPSPAPLDISNGFPELTPEPTVTPGSEMKAASKQNNIISEEVVSVTQDVYNVGLLTISNLQSKILQKKTRLQPDSLIIDSKQSLSRSSDKSTLDLSQADIELLFQAGASKIDVYWVNLLVMGQTKWTSLELLKSKQEKNLSWEEIQKELNKESEAIAAPSVEEDVYGETSLETMWNKRSVVLSSVYGPEEEQSDLAAGALATPSISAFDAAVSSVFNDMIVQAQINQLSKPQFNDRSTSSEMVDPASGSVTRKENLIHLPGVDGLDLDVGLKYNSNQSIPFIYHDHWNTYWQMWDRDINYRLPTLASGWSFQFPSVQRVGDDMVYHDGTGGAYKLGGIDNLSNYTQLIHYKGKDKRYVYAWDQGDFTNGQQSSRSYIEYSDRKREYFDYNGQLIGIVDRFGNTITFNYDNSTGNLSSITDTLKRVVKFSYEKASDSDPYSEENVVIQVINGENEVQQVVLTKSKVLANIPNGAYVEPLHVYIPVLSQITDQIGEKTYFNYDHDLSVYSSYGYNYSSLLKEVNYTHSSTKYEYEAVNRNIGYYETIIEFRAKYRGDYTGEKAYQQIGYTYTGDYAGNTPTQYPANLPDDFRYSTTSTVISSTASNGLRTTNTFDKDGRVLRAETVAANGERNITENTTFHGVFTQSPTRTTISEYAAQDSEATANHLYTETTYTDWGLVQSQTQPLTAEQFNNAGIKQHYTTTYQYEPTYRFLQSNSWYVNESDASPLTESYSYTAQGRVETVTNALGEQTLYTYGYYNSTGGISQVTAEHQAGGQVVAKSVVAYGEAGWRAYPTTQQQWFNIGQSDQQIVTTTLSYDLATGLLASQSDGNQQTTQYEYDAAGRLKKETYPVRTNTKGQTYSEMVEYNYYNQSSANFDAYNAGTSVLKVDSIRTQVSNNNIVRSMSNVLYNGLGLALLEESYDENVGSWIFTQYHYDDQGQPVYQKDALGNEMTVDYNAWGQSIRQTDAYGNVYTTSYDLKQRKTTNYMTGAGSSEQLNYIETFQDPLGRILSQRTYKDWPSQAQPLTESYRYDILGNLTGYTDPLNHTNDSGVTTSYQYDALNRLIAVQDALNQTTRYSYDGNGQLNKVTVQGKGGAEQTLNSKNYNEIGGVQSKLDGAGQSESYTYNHLGQLAGKTDRNGSTFDYSYDEGGQLKNSTISGTLNNVLQTQKTEITYGDATPRYLSTKTTLNAAVQATERLYLNSFGQVRNRYVVAYSTLGAGAHSAYTLNKRDALGRMTQMNDNYLSFFVNYQYNKLRLDKVQTNNSDVISNAASDNVQYAYYANGQVQSITYPTLTGGSMLKTEYTYHKTLSWVESVSNTKGGSVLSKYQYSYDNNGNITAVSETLSTAAGGSGTAQTTSYGYDALNRLISITRPNGSHTTYSYDVRGNRQIATTTADLSVHLADTSYTYDLTNTLTSVSSDGSSTKFEYYADGLRYLKNNGSTSTRVNYDFSGQVISEEKLNGSTVVQKSNYVRGDRVLVKKDKTASKDYYYLYNGHGDVVQIVDTSGNIVNSYAYDEWGNITSQTEGISNPFKYTGEIYDEETGLYYLRARYYDPSIGRFLNEDTYEGQIDNPLSQNLYTYVHNNPLIYNDPTGHKVNKVEVDVYLDLAIQEGKQSDAWWKIRSILGQEAQYTLQSGVDNNYFKYLYNMATGNHYEESTPGNMEWARGKLQQLLEDSAIIQSMMDSVAMGLIGGTTKVTSLIKTEAGLVKAAQQMGKNPAIQKEADDLIAKFLKGNVNPGIGSKSLTSEINYLRGKEGARVFYRMSNGEMQILAKANKANEQTVINILYKGKRQTQHTCKP